MQRLYAMFPAGAPGVGLVLLRLHVLLALLLDPARPGGQLHGLAAALSLLLAAGLLTPLVAAVALLPGCYALFSGQLAGPAALLGLLTPLCLLLLGPGAYSVDARLFGRRVLVARDDERSPPNG